MRRQLRLATAALRRAEAARARLDMRDWSVQRRARTRRLIELGGLVVKSRLGERVTAIEPDQAAVILGALLELAAGLDADPAQARARVGRWRELGRAVLREAPIRAKPGQAETAP